jgi:glutathione peroxidase-family protein
MSNLDKFTQKSQQPETPTNQLSKQEIEVLLSMIKRTTFLGEDLEPLYNLVIKLQEQYIELTK